MFSSMQVNSNVGFNGVNTVNGKREKVDRNFDNLEFLNLAQNARLYADREGQSVIRDLSIVPGKKGSLQYNFKVNSLIDGIKECSIVVYKSGSTDVLIRDSQHVKEGDGYCFNTIASKISTDLVKLLRNSLQTIFDQGNYIFNGVNQGSKSPD